MGRLVVHLHGKTKNKSLSKLISEYQDRLGSISLKILTYSDKLSALDFINKVPDNGEKILLDEGGQEFDSVGFAKFVGSKQISSQDTHFLVGPAQGWDGVERDDYMRLSLSKMTMPHELASLVLIEQIYRATEINKGSNYHKV